MADAYNLVGFQNHLRYGEQARVLRLIPGLERAEFLQYGQIHRNTYINAPARARADIADARAAEQSSSRGRSAASRATSSRSPRAGSRVATRRGSRGARRRSKLRRRRPTGALARYVSGADTKKYQPVNITFALLVPLREEERRRFKKKRDRHTRQVELALEEWDKWLQQIQGGEESRCGRDALREARANAGVRARRRALAACVCALVLLASSSPVLRAQSGRRSMPAPPQGKKGTPRPTLRRPRRSATSKAPSPSRPLALSQSQRPQAGNRRQ